jgi:hypothetical protein
MEGDAVSEDGCGDGAVDEPGFWNNFAISTLLIVVLEGVDGAVADADVEDDVDVEAIVDGFDGMDTEDFPLA